MLKMQNLSNDIELVSTTRRMKVTLHFDIDNDGQLSKDLDIIVIYNEDYVKDEREILEVDTAHIETFGNFDSQMGRDDLFDDISLHLLKILPEEVKGGSGVFIAKIIETIKEAIQG